MDSRVPKKYRKKKNLGSYPYLSVVFSITLALLVIGLFGLLLVHANRLSDVIRENVEIQVYLDRSVNNNERVQLMRILGEKPYVSQQNNQPQISFISREEAAEKFIEETGEDFTEFLGDNPLRDAFLLKINAEYYQQDKLAELSDEIEGMRGVYEVTYVESLVDAINENVTRLSLILGSFAVLLIIIVSVLIDNTIRLALFSQRFLIRSMQLVGATSGFIQRPFLRRSLLHGIAGGAITSALLAALLYYANLYIPELTRLQKEEEIAVIFLATLVFGGLLGVLSTYRAVRKYLKMSLDDLY